MINFQISIVVFLFYQSILFSQNNLTTSTYWNGDIKINIEQIKKTYNDPCSTVINIYLEDSIIHKIVYDTIEALGGTYGIFVSDNPMVRNYFILVKHGDYDGRTLLIENNGDYIDLPGGYYFISEDKKYLFSEHLQDCCDDFIVYNLENKTIVYISDLNVDYDTIEFYKYGNEIYVFSFASDYIIAKYKYDFANNQLLRINETPKSLELIELAPDAINMEQCSCK